jgi:hypothetical protein
LASSAKLLERTNVSEPRGGVRFNVLNPFQRIELADNCFDPNIEAQYLVRSKHQS